MRWPTTVILLLGTLVSICASQDVVAQPASEPFPFSSCKPSALHPVDTEGYVVGLITGWTPADTMSVKLDAHFQNAEECVPLGPTYQKRPCPITDVATHSTQRTMGSKGTRQFYVVPS
jgi:hypothetical protein